MVDVILIEFGFALSSVVILNGPDVFLVMDSESSLSTDFRRIRFSLPVLSSLTANFISARRIESGRSGVGPGPTHKSISGPNFLDFHIELGYSGLLPGEILS